MVTGIKVRIVSLEATIVFEEPIDEPPKGKIVCEIDCKEIRVILDTPFKEKSSLNIKSIKFKFIASKDESNISHEEAWKKIQSFTPKPFRPTWPGSHPKKPATPKSLFKLPIVGFIKL